MDARSRHLLSIGLVANAFEWYEFSIFGFLAGFIGQLFFKSSEPVVGLIQGFLLFAISYLVRPLGGLVFGLMGDRRGNPSVLRLSLLLMSIPTVLIGFLPTYSQGGLIATILLLCLRLVQGFAMAGELPSSARYVFENAEPRNRSLFCSIAMSSTTIGVLLGSSMIALLNAYFDEVTILAWAWRIPFILSIPLTLCIIMMRRALYAASTFTTTAPKLKQNTTSFSSLLLKGIVMISFGTVCFYTTLIWMPSYLTYFLAVPSSIAQWMNTITLIITLPLYPLVGYGAYRWGYATVLFVGICATLVCVIPIFVGLQSQTNWKMLLLFQVILAALFVIVNAVTIELLATLFPVAHRGLGVSLAWALPSSLIGGPTPLIYSYVIHQTNWYLFPAFYIMGFGVLALFVAFYHANLSFIFRAPLK